jgi:ABC-type phosphate transport system permease subunit
MITWEFQNSVQHFIVVGSIVDVPSITYGVFGWMYKEGWKGATSFYIVWMRVTWWRDKHIVVA